MAGVADPEVFWSMTPHEINLVLRGFRRRMVMHQAVATYAAAIGAGAQGVSPPFEDEEG